MKRMGLGFAALLLATSLGMAQNFTVGNLAVMQINNDSSRPLSSSGSPAVIQEFTKTGGAPVTSLVLPFTATSTGDLNSFVLQGNQVRNGFLTRTADGSALVVVGYAAGINMPNLSDSNYGAPPNVHRTIGTIGANRQFQVQVQSNTYGNRVITSAAGVNPTRFYTSGPDDTKSTGELRTITPGPAGTSGVRVSTGNYRVTRVFNDTVFASVANGIVCTTVPLPGDGDGNTGVTQMVMNVGQPVEALDFAIFDRDNNGVVDLMYVADATNTNGVGGIRKYSSTDGINWTFRGVASVPTTGGNAIQGAGFGVMGLAAEINALTGNIDIYATTIGTGVNHNGNALVRFIDAAGSTGDITGSYTLLANAALNTSFRGLDFTPVPEPTTLALVGAGMGLVVWKARRRKKAAR